MLNKVNKKIWAALGTAALLASAAIPALAATTADVSATVTAQLIAVSITTDGTVNYGTLALSTSKDTITLADTQTAKNDSNVTANLKIRSSDAASAGTPWELAAAAGANAFTHEFSTNSGGVWTGFNVDNTTYSTLANSVAAAGTQNFDLRIGMPTSSTDSVAHTITVTVQASL